jgi:hypothetical protein
MFALIGRYFWLVCLGIAIYNYMAGVRSLESKAPSDPTASVDARRLRRWFAIGAVLPWLVMGWGILMGGVPTIWYYFRPQDRNPFVLAWFATMYIEACYFAYWVFVQDGAQKIVALQPFEVRWRRTSLRGMRMGTVALTVGRVKFFAALGPVWITAWIYLVSSTNAPVPK